MAEACLPLGGTAAQVAPNDADKPDGERHDDKEVEEEARADEDEHGGEDDDVDGIFAKGDDGGEHTPFYVGKVVGHAADDVTPTA